MITGCLRCNSGYSARRDVGLCAPYSEYDHVPMDEPYVVDLSLPSEAMAEQLKCSFKLVS